MAPRRKPHRKSRNGCSECKRRRIKCGEEMPSCARCVRYDSLCIYPGKPAIPGTTCGTPISDHPSPLSQTSPKSTPVGFAPHFLPNVGSAIPSEIHFELKDLALFHHWVMIVSRTIVNTPQLDHLYHTTIPQIAFNHPHVMYGILSIAALHVAYSRPLDSHAELCNAAQYHLEALNGLRDSVGSIGPQNSDALFASSILVFFYSFLTFGKLHDAFNRNVDSTAQTPRAFGDDWIPLIRGVEVILHPEYDNIRVGPLKGLLDMGNWDDLDPDTQSDADDEVLLALREIWMSDAKSEVYDKTLYFLRKTRIWMMQFKTVQIYQIFESKYNREWSGPFTWLMIISDEFCTLLRQRQPPALIVFAHFGALFHGLNGYWWAEGCGKNIVSEVAKHLGEYWSPWMQWPKQTVGLIDAVR